MDARRTHSATLDSAALAGFRSGQTGRTVNPLAQPSQVRILLPPLSFWSRFYPRPDMESDLDVASEDLEQAAPARMDRSSWFRVAANRLDSQPALLAAANWLRARLPGDERFGDPLSTAGTAPVEVVARGVASLRPEQRDSLI